jgi:hypothetical protein
MLKTVNGVLDDLEEVDTKTPKSSLACPHASLSTGTLWLLLARTTATT